MHSGRDVLVGPGGWLPDIPRFGLVALRWSGGRLSVEPVAEEALPSPAEIQAYRQAHGG